MIKDGHKTDEFTLSQNGIGKYAFLSVIAFLKAGSLHFSHSYLFLQE